MENAVEVDLIAQLPPTTRDLYVQHVLEGHPLTAAALACGVDPYAAPQVMESAHAYLAELRTAAYVARTFDAKVAGLESRDDLEAVTDRQRASVDMNARTAIVGVQDREARRDDWRMR